MHMEVAKNDNPRHDYFIILRLFIWEPLIGWIKLVHSKTLANYSGQIFKA